MLQCGIDRIKAKFVKDLSGIIPLKIVPIVRSHGVFCAILQEDSTWRNCHIFRFFLHEVGGTRSKPLVAFHDPSCSTRQKTRPTERPRHVSRTGSAGGDKKTNQQLANIIQKDVVNLVIRWFLPPISRRLGTAARNGGGSGSPGAAETSTVPSTANGGIAGLKSPWRHLHLLADT
jgi:hypothetical protein